MTDGFLFSWSLRENLRFRRLFVWFLVSIALFAIAKTVRQIDPSQSQQGTYVLMSGLVVYKLVALVSAIFAMGVVATEIEQKTIVYLLTRPIARFRILFWRTLGAMVAVIVVSIIALLGVSLATYGVGKHALLTNDLVAVTLGACAYTALFVFVSLLVNRAMAYCLVFAFGWETAVPNMSGDVELLSLNTYMGAIGAHPEAKDSSGGVKLLNAIAASGEKTAIAPAAAGYVLLGTTLVALVIAMIWFSSFEYLPREDAE